jgi:flagellar biosynthetic protein FlhB
VPDFEERTEQATPRRRQKAREKGQVPRSREIMAMGGLFGTLMVFYFGGAALLKGLSQLTGTLLDLQYGRDPFTVMYLAAGDLFLIVVPFLIASAACTLFSGAAQGGISVVPLRLHPERLNPLQGIRRIFSLPGLVEFLKSSFKFLVGSLLLFFIVKQAVTELPFVSALDLAEMQEVSTGLVAKAVTYAFLTFLTIALADYLLERWRFERSIRMTRQELREEHKETEGDPLIKSRIKSVQREMARRRMMQEVPKATVVITNPTHLAVALRYEASEMAAPKVVAKGSGFVAERIKDLAGTHGVPTVEDKPLARALFKLPLGTAIPHELYRAVAKILAHIYTARGVA